MSGFHELYAMAHIFAGEPFECVAWVDNWFADLLFVLDWYPLVIYGGTIATTYFDTDLFYLGVSCITYFGVFLNYIGLYIFDESGPQGPDCFYDLQMPSHGSQLITEFVMMFLRLGLYRRHIPDTWTLVGSFMVVYLIFFERLYRNVDYIYQLYAGAALGFVNGLVGFTILYEVLRKFGDDIIEWRIAKWFNIKNEYFGKSRREILANIKGSNKKKNSRDGFQVDRHTRDQPIIEALATLKAQASVRLLPEPPSKHTQYLDAGSIV